MGNAPNQNDNAQVKQDILNSLDQMQDKSPQKEANKPQQRTIYRQNTRQKTQTNQPQKQQQDPNKAIEFKNQGNQAILQKQFSKAVECYTNAIKLYPDTIFYSNRAVAYRLMNALDKALLDARKSVEMSQDNSRGHYLVGTLMILEVQKDKDFGEQLLQKAMEGVRSLDKAWELIKNNTEEGKQKLKASVKLNQGKAKRVVYLIANAMDNRNIDSLNQILQIVIQQSKKKIDLKKFQSIMRKNTIEDVKVPDYYNCIITQEIMRIPVLLSSGYTYDKDSIIQHFKTNGVKDPITRKEITSEPIMNHALLDGIQNLTCKYGWLGVEESDDYKTIKFDS